jgi:hypothetical protein
MYIALKGLYAYKLSYKRWDNPAAYPKRKLYLNLLGKSEDSDLMYDFQFLTESEAKENDDEHFWFLVGDILDLKEQSLVNKYLIKHKLMSNPDEGKAEFANSVLFKLHAVIHVNQIISYYLEQSTELDKVLNIFIRVNSGGTTLSYSDLLLSFATAQWETRDARDEINSFVDEINDIGIGFNIGKDIILKACLVLCDFQDILFKVDNFNRTNMLIIEKNWDDLTKVICQAVTLISSFGYSRENITSNNLIIPIAYYIKYIGMPENFVVSKAYIEDRKKIKKWFVFSLLRRVFSFMPDGVLKPIREIIQKNPGSFPLNHIVEHFKGTTRDLVFTEDNIVNLLYSKYGYGDTLVILSILYPWADLKHHFHVDHIFPKSIFTRKKLLKKGVPEEKIEEYIANYNYLGNLQLLEELPNIEKNNKDFHEWLKETFKDQKALKEYKRKHYIPDVDLHLSNFDEFFEERKALLVDALKQELTI